MNNEKTLYEEKINQIADLLEELILDAFLSVVQKLYDNNACWQAPADTNNRDLPF